jgi:hypothetical protein
MCKGTQQFVHRSCLDHWRSVRVNTVVLALMNMITCNPITASRDSFNNWSYNDFFPFFLQEGFAFSHCTTCKAQFHLRLTVFEDNSWRKIKFRLFVARDVFLVFLAVQTVSILILLTF